MGIFFRKSFRLGPFRFNLSKSGVGVSAGVKGARIGAGPHGPYIAGGKDGIYFRENLSAKNPPRDGWDLRPLFYLGLIIVALIIAFLAFAILRA